MFRKVLKQRKRVQALGRGIRVKLRGGRKEQTALGLHPGVCGLCSTWTVMA